ncbi:hypothetical protein IQ238_28990 [Pleurocapsales cyanobacterium LEGE 06147]|nr:hypothetical protein [Pleurocapsales cyanobacterium LEGE 06147]
MSSGLASLNKDLEDENILTTQKITRLESNLSSFASSSKYTLDKKRLLNNYLTQKNIEYIEFADFMTSMAILENNARQFYTNPVWQQIKINFLQFSSLPAEISNQVINILNSSRIHLVNNLINRLTSLYIFNNLVEIIEYLSEKKYLISLLLEANQRIKEVFPTEKLKLRIIYDPEITGWRKLVIDIHTLLDVDEAFDKLKTLDNIWWLDVSSLVGNDLDININFDEV